jgi:hypothetical protein
VAILAQHFRASTSDRSLLSAALVVVTSCLSASRPEREGGVDCGETPDNVVARLNNGDWRSRTITQEDLLWKKFSDQCIRRLECELRLNMSSL